MKKAIIIFILVFLVGCTQSNTEQASVPTAIPQRANEILDYFYTVALKTEYGQGEGCIKKWTDDIFVYIKGDYTSEDFAVINKHINFLNSVEGVPEIDIIGNEFESNFIIDFITQEEMNIIMADFGEVAWGSAFVWWSSGTYILHTAKIYIVTDTQDQSQRNHAIVEEMTQSLGLLNDSYLYPDSIFQAEFYPDVYELSDIDKEILKLLYAPEMKPGLSSGEAIEIAKKILFE